MAVLDGKNKVVAVRKLSEEKTKKAYVVPYLTSTDFDPKRKSDTKATKSGPVTSIADIETSLKFECYDNTDPILDVLEDSLYNKEKLEFWVLKLDKKDEQGRCFGYYMQGSVSEISGKADPDANSTAEITVAVDGEPKRGYTTLPETVQAQIDYVFRGIDLLGEDNGKGIAVSETETPSK